MSGVLVLAALDQELVHLSSVIGARPHGDVAGSVLLRGGVGGLVVYVARTGVGKVNAAVTTSLALAETGADTVICVGVGGALDPDLAIGDVVVGEKTIQHDAGVLRDGGLEPYQPGHVPFFNPTDEWGYTPSRRLLEVTRTALEGASLGQVSDAWRSPRVQFGVIATGDQFLDGPMTRDRLHRAHGAKVIEMEGAAVAQVADRLGVDHLVVRAASDLAGAGAGGSGGGAISDFNRFLSQVAKNSAHVVSLVLDALSSDGD